jgi:uncharacterized protein YxeA
MKRVLLTAIAVGLSIGASAMTFVQDTSAGGGKKVPKKRKPGKKQDGTGSKDRSYSKTAY